MDEIQWASEQEAHEHFMATTVSYRCLLCNGYHLPDNCPWYFATEDENV